MWVSENWRKLSIFFLVVDCSVAHRESWWQLTDNFHTRRLFAGWWLGGFRTNYCVETTDSLIAIINDCIVTTIAIYCDMHKLLLSMIKWDLIDILWVYTTPLKLTIRDRRLRYRDRVGECDCHSFARIQWMLNSAIMQQLIVTMAP